MLLIPKFLETVFSPGKSFLEIPGWMRMKYRRPVRSAIYISRSKYKPHQGEREMARRIKQVKEGKIR